MVVVASLTVVVGCSRGSTDEGSRAETVTVTSSSSSSATQETRTETATETAPASETAPSSSTPDTASSSDTAAGDLPTDVAEYADSFVRAWGIGDRDDASRYATSTAISDLFAMDSRGGSGWTRQDSTEQGTRTQVKYTDDNDSASTLYVLVDRDAATSGSPDAVVGASLEYELGEDYSYDPGEESAGISDITVPETTTADYCDALVRAWGAGNRTTADQYATQTAMDGLFGDQDVAGGSGWSRTSSTSYSATYTNTDGSTLTLSVNSISVDEGRGDGVFYAEFG